MRARTAVAVALTAVLAIGGQLPAAADQADVDAARARANGVAADLADARTRLAELEGRIVELQAEASTSGARVDELRGELRAQAVARFMSGGTGLDPVDSAPDPDAAERADTLAGFVGAATLDATDAYVAATEDLRATEDELASAESASTAAVAELEEVSAEATAELEQLERVEAERRAREEAERLAREEAERRAREAAAAQAAAEQAARDEDARAARDASAREASARDAEVAPSRSVTAASAAPRAVAPVTPVPAPRTVAPTTARAPAPASAPAPVVASGSWVCPVQGAVAFTNDWGQPRSGGRRHQGTDMLAARGTPVVAPVSGSARGHSSSLGGISFYLDGADGTTYFGTHLDSLSGASGQVSAGTVLGYVGSTGNATGGSPHLHFEIHPGGGAPVNPYPTLTQHC